SGSRAGPISPRGRVDNSGCATAAAAASPATTLTNTMIQGRIAGSHLRFKTIVSEADKRPATAPVVGFLHEAVGRVSGRKADSIAAQQRDAIDIHRPLPEECETAPAADEPSIAGAPAARPFAATGLRGL